jgi:hypothetical protein
LMKTDKGWYKPIILRLRLLIVKPKKGDNDW